MQNNRKCKKTYLETDIFMLSTNKKQSSTKPLWSLNKGSKTKYVEII